MTKNAFVDSQIDALKGLRVVDFSRIGPGPMATMMLSDYGADVIRIEEPAGGQRARDQRRLRGLPENEWTGDELKTRAQSPVDRNKRSIALNLKNPRGLDAALKIACEADVILESFRPGVMKRLGLDYEAIRARNPRIIYCSISGYGQTGPRAHFVGHDLNYLADSGALSLFADRQGDPIVPINMVADYSAGSLRAFAGILLAVIARGQTGQGQFVDVAMADGLIALAGIEVATVVAGKEVPRSPCTRLTGGVAYYNVYKTKDGRWITIACNEPHFFSKLCAALDVPELAARQLLGPDDQEEMKKILRDKFKQRTLKEWSALLDADNSAWAPLRLLDEIVTDEHYLSRSALTTQHDPNLGAVVQVGPVVPLSSTPGRIRFLGKAPGYHSRAILSEYGFTAEDIDRLFKEGAVA
jgi:crotonobetainyl-CoA:carnitine CoA-transferase CaiB-like acyl-CoA transferase